MKNKITEMLYALLFLLVCFSGLTAQIPGMPVMPLKEKKNVFGGTALDMAYSIVLTIDGGYVVAGQTQSNNGDVSGNQAGSNMWIIKFSARGDIQWQKKLGGANVTVAHSIIQTTDGGYAVTGYTFSTNYDVLVVKLSAAGDLQWQATLGGTGSEQARSIVQTTDGGYVLAGQTQSNNGNVSGNGSSNMLVVKLSSEGFIEWQKMLGGTDYDEAWAIVRTTDGGYVVAGTTLSNDGNVSGNHGNYDMWVVKLSSAGSIQWQKTLGGTNIDSANSIIQTTDGGYVVAGETQSNDGDVSGNHGSGDMWVVKLNATGTIQWQKTLGGASTDLAYSIIQTTDGGYVLAGQTQSNNGDVSGNHGNNDMWVVKLNPVGTIQWQKTLGGTDTDLAFSVIKSTDTEYIVAGYTRSIDGDVAGPYNGSGDFFIIRLDTTAHVIRLYEDTPQ